MSGSVDRRHDDRRHHVPPSFAGTILRPLQDFLHTESASGLLLLAMVPIALVWANGPFADSYESLWTTELGIRVGDAELKLDLRHWVNDGLMSLFFFVVGLEIKRELVDGQLRDPRRAITPVFAAIGGMAFPALLYLLINRGGEGAGGWGIPIATDIAIVLGVLALAGNRVPSPLKVFLLTVAIVDDIGAIIVIALFFPEHAINFVSFGTALALFAILHLMHRFGFRIQAIYVVLALAAWLATYSSGVHATLAGVVLAMLTPAKAIRQLDVADAEQLTDVSTYGAASETATIARQSVSSVEWLQHLLHPWSSYVVLPIFALANAGVVITSEGLRDAISSPVAGGIVVGLLIGKPVGICMATLLASRAFRAQLPAGVSFMEVMAGSMLASIGFTVSLFISDLAFTDAKLIAEAKIGVLGSSAVAGLCGYVALRTAIRHRAPVAEESQAALAPAEQ